MRIPAPVGEQLLFLPKSFAQGGYIAEALTRLGRDVALAVPSTVAVTIVVARAEGEINVNTLAQPATVLASFAVPLYAGAATAVLILRASTAGAYLLLADDLAGPLGPDHRSAEVDAHLSWPDLVSESLADSLAELASIDRAIGLLFDQGSLPEEALDELARRARVTGATVATVSRELLVSLQPESSRQPPNARGRNSSEMTNVHGEQTASGRWRLRRAAGPSGVFGPSPRQQVH